MSRPVASSMGYLVTGWMTGWPESALYRYAVVIYADIMFGYELFHQQPDRNNNRACRVYFLNGEEPSLSSTDCVYSLSVGPYSDHYPFFYSSSPMCGCMCRRNCRITSRSPSARSRMPTATWRIPDGTPGWSWTAT